MDDPSEIGRSTLLFITARLVGFGFVPHPQRKKWSIHIVFYHVEAEHRFIICLGEVKGKGNPELMRSHLGTMVPGREFLPFAQRDLTGMELEEFKQIIAESYDTPFEWWE